MNGDRCWPRWQVTATVGKTPTTAGRDGRRTWGLWLSAVLGAGAARPQRVVAAGPVAEWRTGGESTPAAGPALVTGTAEFAAARAAQTPYAVVMQRGRGRK